MIGRHGDQLPDLLTFYIAAAWQFHCHAEKCAPEAGTPPAKAHLGLQMPKIKAKRPAKPRKASPFICVFSRLRSPRGFSRLEQGQKEGVATLPKVLTSILTASRVAGEACRALPTEALPQKLTLS